MSPSPSKGDAYRKNEVLPFFTTVLVCARRELDGSLDDGLCQLVCRTAFEWSSAEEEFKDANAQAPVVHVPCITFTCDFKKGTGEALDRTTRSERRQRGVNRRTGEYLWRHVCYATSHTGVQSTFRVVNRHVEVGEMSISVSIQDDVVWLDIAACGN